MTRGSELLLYLFLGIPVLFILFYLFLIGPVGWFTIGFLALGGMAVMAYLERNEAHAATKTNCSACGARNDADRETCHYCESPL